MKTFKWSTLALAVSTLLSHSVIAEEADSEKENEEYNDNVVKVTGSKSGRITYVSASGTKSSTPIIETPLSVSVLTEKRIIDLGSNSVQDGLGYVAGVYNGPFGVDARGDWSAIRGVAPVQYLDGLKMTFGFYNNTRPSIFNLSRIEVLKGPSSVLYGQGSTGGIVNLVSKRPEAETKGEIWGQLGSFDRVQAGVDFTGAVNDDASVLYRFNALVRESETQVDFVEDNSIVISPSLTWFMGDDTELTLLANIQENESGSSVQFFPHVGTIFPAPNGQIPHNRFVSEPDFDRYDTEQNAVTAILKHDFSEEWSLQASARYMSSEADYRTMYAFPFALQADNRSLLRSFYVSDASADVLTSDIRMHGNFTTGSVEHNFVVGLDYQDAETDNNSLFAFNMGGLLDVYNPTYGAVTIPPISQLPIPDAPATLAEQTGLYVQDQMKIDGRWIVSAAFRTDTAETGAEGGVMREFDETTGRLGFMYLFDNGLSPYINYAESFELVDAIDVNGNPLDPKRGEQIEVGIKFQPQGTEHLITAAYYDILEKDRPTPVSPTASASIGEVEVSGFEIEAQLEWDEVDVYASYTKTDTEITRSNDPALPQGSELESVPDQMLSVWATYRPEEFWHGFKVGGGARHVGESFFFALNNNVPTPTTTDSYTLVDLMVGYEFDNVDLSLNIANVTDKMVVTTCLSRGDCFYGQERTVTANLRYRF
ncbi:TonB-dependent siderophore receptor [Pleionea sp. CnH1-48]|uniref:TonB-dependent siderophore receptor n=1 Tax=Pleionea sp. CnH1-48 TaxID=2954494 RepID=UPI002097C948|nr:TonB-dependent siderophore receptor [Pleionea sp. CnH1-48]MCO7224557.1 TonB-dependent siderophore receptor [Pleionea sp. CnH1-48]